MGQHLWQDDQIGLDITRSQPRRITENSPARMRNRSRVPAATPAQPLRSSHHTHTSNSSYFTTPRLEMHSMSVLYLAAAIVLEICGTTSLKLSQGFTRIGPAGAVVVCYAASFALLSVALRGIDLSIAYAVWSGVGTAIVAVIGILWFGEPAGAWKLLSWG